METYVYIIQSSKTGRFYTGVSIDPSRRLIQHNEGGNTSTKTGKPWELIWISDSLDHSDALILEKKIKKRGAGRFLQDLKTGL